MNSSVRPGPKSRIRQDRDRGRDRRRARVDAYSSAEGGGRNSSGDTVKGLHSGLSNTIGFYFIEDNKRLTILLDKNFGIYSRGGTTEDTGHTHAALAHWPIFILKYQRQRPQRAPFGSARRAAGGGRAPQCPDERAPSRTRLSENFLLLRYR
ncbi:hypothetical protein EVAR_39371_1 [Eumeta japonica]|uniref:Uncharacterized protein n=1 Tax=Eumeta variegata TaxID=151549 RepID=A0A4C1ZCT9_EUMVA|nr:hypothetical protein EVAR_39371_1 [Eumeta japonica]